MARIEGAEAAALACDAPVQFDPERSKEGRVTFRPATEAWE
jgi:hypothetical protein